MKLRHLIQSAIFFYFPYFGQAQTTALTPGLSSQMYVWPGWTDLPNCVAEYIAPGKGVYCGSGHNLRCRSGCDTKDCFCGASQREWMYNQLWVLYVGAVSSCSQVEYFNDAVTWLGDFCGFAPVYRVPYLSLLALKLYLLMN